MVSPIEAETALSNPAEPTPQATPEPDVSTGAPAGVDQAPPDSALLSGPVSTDPSAPGSTAPAPLTGAAYAHTDQAPLVPGPHTPPSGPEGIVVPAALPLRYLETRAHPAEARHPAEVVHPAGAVYADVQRAPGVAAVSTIVQSAVESFVPAVLVAPLRRVLAVDLADVAVRRGDDVSRVAHRIGARGFARDGVAHVPESAGDLAGAAAPLLAHELTHVAQQRRFGAALPGPDTAVGRQLEDEAVAVEHWVAGGVQAAPPLVHGHLPQVSRPGSSDEDGSEEDEERKREFLARLRAAVAAKGATDLGVGPQALPSGITPEDIRAIPSGTELPGGAQQWSLDQFFRNDAGSATDDGPPRVGSSPPGDGDDSDGSDPGLSLDDIDDHLVEDPPLRWMDLDDQDHFEELADRLYTTLIGRLRFDVLVERERTGTLLDFG
ncbi:eCIS core domain-containing protein [Actinokineospora spheciospongiae]|uniref:eCIS core domain-containing protein n=1 Tax=Actinokineospora spheciospongiae TaxID=909613 RepID=UPI0015E8718B|nr:DUF4157 domain-containing protein [Actinokineospora spheciospongiae]